MISQESTEPPPPPPHSTENQLESVPSPSRSSSSSPSSRLNAGAPEFVPRNTTPRLVLQPSSPLFHVPHQSYGVGVSSGKQPQTAVNSDHAPPPVRNNGGGSGGGLSEDSRNKILNQVEYYFSDVNLATTDHLMKFISKDPDGYVPISVVVSFKKIKALVSSCQQLATLLRKSSKLAVSDDGKKVKRQIPLTEADMEELQSRIVLAENLPEDHSYQNLMRVFSSVGSVKTIRTCQPQNGNGNGNAGTPRSKLDNNFLSNKLHAFVEYESVEIAEKAVSELNDVRNWRSGLKVRLMPKRSPSKSNSQGGRGRKFGEEDDLSTSEQMHLEDNLSSAADITFHEHSTSVEDKERRGRGGNNGTGRGGKGRGRSHRNHNNNNNNNSNNNNNIIGTPPWGEHLQLKPPPGPRMPDGTRGFALGRGKPLHPSSNV